MAKAWLWQQKEAMVRSCSAIGCANRVTKETQAKEIKFYRIPVNPDKHRLWLAAMQRKDFNPLPDAAFILLEASSIFYI